jgi:hypothetical protein
MSHIAVDLKVIEVHAPSVARTLGESVATTLGGLNLLWHRCWSTQQARITRIGLAGVFGIDNIDLRIEAMVDAGFLEPVADMWRVCGAEKYLRIREGNQKGGHASKSNLIPGAKHRKEPMGEPRATRDGAEREPMEVIGSASALTPSTEHRAPSTLKEDIHPLQSAWNENRAPTMPKWTSTGSKRRRHADARLGEHSLEDLTAAIRRLAASEFASGRTGKWAASPDWLVESGGNVIKVLEGNYDNRPSQGTTNTRSPAPVADWTNAETGEVAL